MAVATAEETAAKACGHLGNAQNDVGGPQIRFSGSRMFARTRESLVRDVLIVIKIAQEVKGERDGKVEGFIQ